MRFALAPGDVYIPTRSSNTISKARRNLRAKDPIKAVIRRLNYPYLSTVLKAHQARQAKHLKYGCQVLATCKQLYCEGHAAFYSLNTFHLAPGPLCSSTEYFDNLQPHHKALIKHVAVDIGIADVTTHLLSELNAKVSGRSINMPVRSATPSQDIFAITDHLGRATMRMWLSKLMWLETWQGLKDKKLQHHSPRRLHGPMETEWQQVVAEELCLEQKQLRGLSAHAWERESQLSMLFRKAHRSVSVLLIKKVAEYGWNGFSEWMDCLEAEPMGYSNSQKGQKVCFRPLRCGNLTDLDQKAN